MYRNIGRRLCQDDQADRYTCGFGSCGGICGALPFRDRAASSDVPDDGALDIMITVTLVLIAAFIVFNIYRRTKNGGEK